MIIFFIVVAIYISIRFEPKMALAAFIAMIHDVLVAIGIYSIFNFQVTPDTVVAILTILGYSLYDTVVVFDRVRDNTKGIGSSGRLTVPAADQPVHEPDSGPVDQHVDGGHPAGAGRAAHRRAAARARPRLQSYGLALFVGLLSGAYSSIFIASPVLCMMKEREDRWVQIASRLAKRGEAGSFYSAADAAYHEHGDQRGRFGPGQPGRRGRCHEEVRRHQAQRPDPPGLWEQLQWRHGGHGPPGGRPGQRGRRGFGEFGEFRSIRCDAFGVR